MPDALDHIRLIRAAAETGAPLPRITAQWLDDGFRTIERNRRLRLEAALGLTARGGVGGLSRRMRLATRDGLLRDIRRRFYPDHTPREAARAMLILHQRRETQASEPSSDLEELIDAVLAIGRPMPEEKQLARIIGTRIAD